MATTIEHTTKPIMHYWGMVKDLDDSQKLELVTLLVNSVKPSVAKIQAASLENHSLKPYTIEELHMMVAEGEQQFAEGLWQDSEDVFRELKEDLAQKEQTQACVSHSKQLYQGNCFLGLP